MMIKIRIRKRAIGDNDGKTKKKKRIMVIWIKKNIMKIRIRK